MNERTRLIFFIAISAIILLTYQPVFRYFGWLPSVPTTIPSTSPTTTAAPTPIATMPTVTSPTGTTQSTSAPAASLIPSLPMTPQLVSTTDLSTSRTIVLGSDQINDPNYALQLSINPVGGGLNQVILNKYKQKVDSDERFAFVKPYAADHDEAFSTQSITINDKTFLIGEKPWRTEKAGDSAMLTLELATPAPDSKPLVRIQKTFQVLPRSADANSPQGYEIKFAQKVTNLSGEPLNISTTIIGPTFPASEMSRGGDRQLIGGYKKDAKVVLRYDALESFTKDAPSKDYTTDKENHPLLWIGAGTNYFNAIIKPDEPWIAKVVATAVNPEAEAHHRQLLIAIETAPTGVLAAGASRDLSANVFFGPRLRSLLHNPYYSAAGYEYFHTLEISGSCTYCAFSSITDFLMMLLGFFHNYIFRDWGLAIIALVFLVRACLHPITKRSQVSMAKMAKMGPEIERIKKKYGDDKEAMNRAMMEFYKNHGATPILGCLPMFLQMPIWISLYSGLSTTFELRHEPFLYGLTWIRDLSKPDHLMEFQQPFNLLFLHIDGLNIIPLLLMVAFYMQYKLQPKPPAMTPEQKQQQKMMMWMTTLLFPLMLYPMPSGLNIYIFASTLFGVIESKIIRNHITQQEALKPVGVQFVDGEVVDPHRNKDLPAKSGGIFGWFAKLQQRAEELRHDAEKQKPKKRQ